MERVSFGDIKTQNIEWVYKYEKLKVLEIYNIESDYIINLDQTKLFMLLFADDAVIIVFTESAEIRQNILNQIENDCNAWGLKLNTSKTKIMIFERGRHTTYNLNINNQPIEVVKSFKYLGVHLFIEHRRG